MKIKILLLVCGGLFLGTSCGTTKKVQKNDDKEITTVTTTDTIPPQVISHPPVYIEGGTRKKIFYVGMPSTVKVYAEGGNTAHLDVSVSGGELIPADLTKGLYSYTEKIPGIAVEVVAKDTSKGIVVSEIFDVVEIPAPDAYVGKYRKPVDTKRVEFTVEEFKQQDVLMLKHDERVPARCDAESYTLIHINKEGKRAVHANQNKRGMFDETTQAMISNAQQGDIFIFENIKSTCSPYPVKNIVYLLK